MAHVFSDYAYALRVATLLDVTIALLMVADLSLCGTHFPTTSELSQFVLASPTAKRRMLEPLASILENEGRERFSKERFSKETLYK